MTIHVQEDLRLELTNTRHAEALFFAIDHNREHLSKFLSWVKNMQSVTDTVRYIKNCEQLHLAEKEVSFVICHQERLVGRIGLHHLDILNKNAAIGYWLTSDAEGKGIISTACKKIISYGFGELGLNRIEIKAATQNRRSRAVPARLNFTEEGILRQAELVNHQFVDLVLYSLLKEEWNNSIE